MTKFGCNRLCGLEVMKWFIKNHEVTPFYLTLIIDLKSYELANNSYSLFSNGMRKRLDKCTKFC